MLLEITIHACRNSQHIIILLLHLPTFMNVTDYWPIARGYSVWIAAVAALQFWRADLKAHVFSNTNEQAYNAFLYSTSTHLLHQQPDEVLFSHFVTTLNIAFESNLTLEDEGYESGSENLNIPTPLRRTSRIHHISSGENVSFDPVTPHIMHTNKSHHKAIWCHLTFSSSDEEDTLPVNNSLPPNVAPLQKPHSKYTIPICDDLDDDKIEEDFQTISFEDDHWTMEEIPDRPLCIHEHSVSHEFVHTHAHIWITHLHHTTTPWTWVTFPSLRIRWPHPVTKTFLL